jgi:hypothetical protein
MSKLKVKAKEQENSKNYLDYINPCINTIIQDVIDSRIPREEQNQKVLIGYKRHSNNQIVYLAGDKTIYDINIFVHYKTNKNGEDIDIIIEHWKFKINIGGGSNIELKGKSGEISKKKINKLLHTYFRNIKTIENILPLQNILKKKKFGNDEYYVEIEQDTEEEKSVEKKIPKMFENSLELKDGKYFNISLRIRYFENSRVNNYKPKTDFEKREKLLSQLSRKTYETAMVEDKKDKEDEDSDEDNGKIPVMSNIVSCGAGTGNDIQVEQKSPKDVEDNMTKPEPVHDENEEKLKSLMEFRHQISLNHDNDDIMNKENIMGEDLNKLNEVKKRYNLHFWGNKLITENLSEEMEGKNYEDLIIYHPKNEVDKPDLMSNLMSDYIELRGKIN